MKKAGLFLISAVIIIAALSCDGRSRSTENGGIMTNEAETEESSEVLDILTGTNYFYQNNTAIPTRTFNQLSGQQRIYGTWASVNEALNVNNAVIFSGDKMIWYNGSNLRVIRIDSFTAINNTGTDTSARFPNGYRIRGVYTEGDRNGEAYNLPWYISTDNRSLIQGSAGAVVYNRY